MHWTQRSVTSAPVSFSEKQKERPPITGRTFFLIGKKMVEVPGIEPGSLSSVR